MENNKFQGKRAELGVYDDACGFTPEEQETYHNMLVNRSFDTGLNILSDKFWIDCDDGVEFVVPPKSNSYCFPATNIVCGYIEGSHEIKIDATPSQDSLQEIIDNIIKQCEKAND